MGYIQPIELKCMIKKILNIPKKYWIMLHVLLLLIVVPFILNIIFGGQEVPTRNYEYEEVRTIFQMMDNIINYVGVIVLVGIFLFPSLILNVIYSNLLVEYSIGPTFIDELYTVTIFIIPLVLFFMYYVLWLVPDMLWGSKLYVVKVVRVLWFILAVVSIAFVPNIF